MTLSLRSAQDELNFFVRQAESTVLSALRASQREERERAEERAMMAKKMAMQANKAQRLQ
jgi:hypothetical protein